jgi:hypothetical protein
MGFIFAFDIFPHSLRHQYKKLAVESGGCIYSPERKQRLETTQLIAPCENCIKMGVPARGTKLDCVRQVVFARKIESRQTLLCLNATGSHCLFSGGEVLSS